jgi:peptidylprolyl isomerase
MQNPLRAPRHTLSLRIVLLALASVLAAVPAVAQPNPQPPQGIPPITAPIQTAYALRYQQIRPGTGPAAMPGMMLTVQYTGWLAANGTQFDSSRDRASAQFPQGEPFQFVLGGHQVIPGWDTGLVGMHVGGIRRLLIPWQLAYGSAGRPPVIPPQADLVFDVELLNAAPPDPTTDPYGPLNPPANTPPAPPQPPTPPTPPNR